MGHNAGTAQKEPTDHMLIDLWAFSYLSEFLELQD